MGINHKVSSEKQRIERGSYMSLPVPACHPLCDMFYRLSYVNPVRRFHLSCLTCYRRRLHYRQRGWQGLKRYMHFEVVADSIHEDGSPLPQDYRIYWFTISKEGPRRIKKDITIADSLNPLGTILPKSFSAYFIFMPTSELATRTYRNMLRKTFLTIAEFIAQV